MKKILVPLLGIAIFLKQVSLAAAQSVDDVIGKVEAPTPIAALGPGGKGISTVLNNTIQLIYVAAGIIFIFMVLISGLQWITSGGDKEAVGNARRRLTWAIIGIVLLALAWVIINVIGDITGFQFFEGQVKLTK